MLVVAIGAIYWTCEKTQLGREMGQQELNAIRLPGHPTQRRGATKFPCTRSTSPAPPLAEPPHPA